MASFAREGQQIFMAALFASHTGKAVAPIAAIEKAVDHFFGIRPPEAIPHKDRRSGNNPYLVIDVAGIRLRTLKYLSRFIGWITPSRSEKI